jgi:hypothetical protein
MPAVTMMAVPEVTFVVFGMLFVMAAVTVTLMAAVMAAVMTVVPIAGQHRCGRSQCKCHERCHCCTGYGLDIHKVLLLPDCVLR